VPHATVAKDAKDEDAEKASRNGRGEGFRADLVVEGTVIVELKSVEQLAKVHSKQVLTQLRLSGRKLGLLINFSEAHLRHGIERIVDGLAE